MWKHLVSKQQIKKPTIFQPSDRFVLKYVNNQPALISEDLDLLDGIPQLCTELNPYGLQSGITCMQSHGSIVINFNPQKLDYRYTLFGDGSDDTFISHGTCQKF